METKIHDGAPTDTTGRAPLIARTRKQIQSAMLSDQAEKRKKWKRVVPAAHELWAKLAPEELVKMDGNVHKLAGLVQLRYNTTREDADQQVAAFMTQNLQ